jgi:hypothetical protein
LPTSPEEARFACSVRRNVLSGITMSKGDFWKIVMLKSRWFALAAAKNS